MGALGKMFWEEEVGGLFPGIHTQQTTGNNIVGKATSSSDGVLKPAPSSDNLFWSHCHSNESSGWQRSWSVTSALPTMSDEHGPTEVNPQAHTPTVDQVYFC